MSEELEKEVYAEAQTVAKKVNKAPLDELPEKVDWDTKLFEVKQSIDKTNIQTTKGLQHLENKIDWIYKFLVAKMGPLKK